MSAHQNELPAAKNESYSRGDVIKIIQSVVELMQDQPPPINEQLRQELKDLAEVIERVRMDLASQSPTEIGKVQIPSATDELDEIVAATEKATNTIMDAAESIAKIADELPEDQSTKLTGQTDVIFEACSFQDITGQRVTKVVGLLHDIEEKVRTLLDFIGESALTEGVDAPEKSEEDSLENGPQLPGQGMSQEDIDKLLADFD